MSFVFNWCVYMAILVELRVIPIGTGSTSLSSYVASVINVVRNSGYRYVLGPMGTSIEINSFNDLAKLLNDIAGVLRDMNVNRIVIDIAMDIRLDKEISLIDKVKSIEEKLQN